MMRTFDYRRDWNSIRIDVSSYIKGMIMELSYLIEMEGLDIYKNALEVVKNFNDKYPDLSIVKDKIQDELLSPENVEYAFEHKQYKEDASKTGVEFQKDLYKIFEIEESLSKIAEKAFEGMTPFEQIENGKEFMIVGHASFLLPGVSNNPNYRKNSKEYLSCSLVSNNELNIFMDHKIVYIMGVNEENFIASSYFDAAARESQYPSIHSMKKVELDNGDIEYIDIGYTHDSKRFALSIATPKVLERLSLERE